MTETPFTPDEPAATAPMPATAGGNQMFRVVAIAVVVLLAAVGGIVYSVSKDDGTSTGAPVAAGCDPVITRPTDRNQQHINSPTTISYPDAPPAFGEHRPDFPKFGRSFYAADRPEIGNMVHTLEHGYTIAWYDDTAAEDADQVAALQKIAADYQADFQRFIAAPWHPSDGAAFPEGRHVALVRWSADPKDPGNPAGQRGNWMYCGGIDAAAITTFFDTWPNAASPEPGIL